MSYTDISSMYKNHFKAIDYLNEYFRSLDEDEKNISRELFAFLNGKKFNRAIDFGCGPTVNHTVAIAPYVDEIDMADYVPDSIFAVAKWLHNEPDAFNWDDYLAEVVTYETGQRPSDEDLRKRIAEARSKIKRLVGGDITKSRPTGDDAKYDLVLSCFCVDAVATNKKEWKQYMDNQLSLLAPGGSLFLTSLHNASWYRVGSRIFPDANVDDKIMSDYLKSFKHLKDIDIKVIFVNDARENGYERIMIVTARDDRA